MNLDTVLREIAAELDSRGLAVFHSDQRSPEVLAPVSWNVETHPDFRQFLDAGQASGARLVTLYSAKFGPDRIEWALEKLEGSGLAPHERRGIEARLRELSIYEGLTCHVELSFQHGQRDYIFDLRADWYEMFEDLLDEIEDFDRAEDEEPLSGGYFSKN